MIPRIAAVLLLTLAGCRDPRLLQCEPSPEVCNGLDDDCDGVIDNLFPRDCSPPCGGLGTEFCTRGGWVCVAAQGVSTEVCNGLDDDCNGQIDDLDVVPCYDRDQSELKSGGCRFGLTRCVLGSSACVGQVGPTPEVCNGLDDDCNGLVDDGIGAKPLDLVFVVDNSDSMAPYMPTVAEAAQHVAAAHSGDTNIRWALLGAPAKYERGAAPPVSVIVNLGLPGAFSSQMALQDGLHGSGNEPTLDAICQLTDADNPLGLSWGSSNRAVLMFTDAPPQSFATPPYTLTDVALRGASFHVFALRGLPTAAPAYDPWTLWTTVATIHELDAPVLTLQSEIESLVMHAVCGGK